MRKVRSFSVDDVLDLDIIKHLDKQSNASEYIKRLIRNDINNKPEILTETQKEEVMRIVLDMLKDKNISIDKKEEEIFDEDAVAAVDQFDFK